MMRGTFRALVWLSAGSLVQLSGCSSAAPAQAHASAGQPASVSAAKDEPAGGANAPNASTSSGGVAASSGAGGAGGSGGAPQPDASANVIPAADSFPRLEASMFGTAQTISMQFNLAESPVWDFCQSAMLFVDVNNQKIHSYAPGGQIGVYVDQTNFVNGIIFEPDGHMLLAEMGGGMGGRVTRMGRDKKTVVLIDHDTMGAKLQTTDDLYRRSDGAIYFTDPIVSHGSYVNKAANASPRSFYLLKPAADSGGERELVNLGMLKLPNGIRLSRDEKTLYVSEENAGRVVKYDVMPDGTLGPGTTFASVPNADSMCLDAAGNVYVGGNGGLHVLRPDGSQVTVIPITSSRGTTNCGFGGPEGKTLFITAWTTLGELDNAPIPGLDWYKNRNIPCQ